MRDIRAFQKYLPQRIAFAVGNLPHEVLKTASEIRLRYRGAASVTAGKRNLPFDSSGRVCGQKEAVSATQSELAECVSLLARGSMYTVSEFLPFGYLPLQEGGRAGVCGKGLTKNGELTGFLEVTSVDLRLHKNVVDFAAPLIKEFCSRGPVGTVVISPPGMGKTTFLRSAALLLARGVGIRPYRVGVADEREELMAGMTELGLMDVLSGVKKSRALEILTRTMSPQVLICDELNHEDALAVSLAQNTGVALIASAHASGVDDLKHRRGLWDMVCSGAFRLAVTLTERDGEFCCSICDTDVLK